MIVQYVHSLKSSSTLDCHIQPELRNVLVKEASDIEVIVRIYRVFFDCKTLS